jgi:hypothetical protein
MDPNCPRCGLDLPPGSYRFCPECGYHFDGILIVQPQKPSKPAPPPIPPGSLIRITQDELAPDSDPAAKPDTQKNPWYFQTWFISLLILIIFQPLGILLMWLQKPIKSPFFGGFATKLAITIIFGGLWYHLFLSGLNHPIYPPIPPPPPTQLSTSLSPRISPVSPPPPASGHWRPVKSWRGAAMKKTEDFVITGPQWSISWSTTPDSNAQSMGLPPNLMLSVYSGRADFPIEMCQGKGPDKSIIRGSGTYYIEINPLWCAYDIKVEEFTSN